MFVIVIAVMSIAMGVAVQTAEFQMRREREAELIFRGEQFIEAIRLYKTKYGRYPMQLKEIYEAKPRVIRKKWKDPITDSENWGIVFLGQEGRQVGAQGRQLAGPGARQGARQGTQSERDLGASGDSTGGGARPFGTPAPFGSPSQMGADRKVGPIVGVHSTSCDEAVKVYEGHTTYCEWRFIFKEERQQGRGGQSGRRPGKLPNQPGDELPFGVPPDALRPPGSRDPGGSGPPGSNPPPPIQTPRP
jgi:type II secretory pathway pseudopilin PulG